MPGRGSYPSRPKVEFDDEGRIVTLLENFVYVDPVEERWTAPKGAKADGASIPRPLWPLIGGPFEGKYRNASIIHDFYCSKRHKPWQKVHRMFYDAMITSGVGNAKAMIMYGGVYKFGPKWTEMDTHNTLIGIPSAGAIGIAAIIFGPIGIVDRTIAGISTLPALTFNAAKVANKKRVIAAPAKTKPKLHRRPALSNEDVLLLQDKLRTRGEDLDSIERQVDEMFSARARRSR